MDTSLICISLLLIGAPPFGVIELMLRKFVKLRTQYLTFLKSLLLMALLRAFASKLPIGKLF